MEYHPLGDIGRHIRRYGALEESVARPIAEQILRSVFVLHERNFIYRDIKPEVRHLSPLVLLSIY